MFFMLPPFVGYGLKKFNFFSWSAIYLVRLSAFLFYENLRGEFVREILVSGLLDFDFDLSLFLSKMVRTSSSFGGASIPIL